MDKVKKHILFAKWFERLGLLAMGSLVFQGIIREGGFDINAVFIGALLAIVSYGLAFYLILTSKLYG